MLITKRNAPFEREHDRTNPHESGNLGMTERGPLRSPQGWNTTTQLLSSVSPSKAHHVLYVSACVGFL